MTFRNSMLVTLTAVAIAAGWMAATTGTDAPGPLRRPATAPASSPSTSLACEVPTRTHPAGSPTDSPDRKVRDDLPLSGNDDILATCRPVRSGRLGE
jgi:hypothetical protein